MVQQPRSSRRSGDRLATRVSQSPPLGLVGGVVAILVMVLALAGVLPRVIFFLAAAGLIALAYTLDKRFKANEPPSVAPPLPTSALVPPVPTTPTAAPPPTGATAPTAPSSLPHLQAEHARLTQELTDRVDNDEDVRFEKFMRLRAIEQELLQQTQQPPT